MKRFTIFLLYVFLSLTVFAQDDIMYAHYINVGQANTTLLQFPCGIVLIDAGSQDQDYDAKLIEYLDDFFESNEQYDSTIDAIIITHNHIDHTRMLREICEKYKVKNYVDNGQLIGKGKYDPIWIRENAPEIVKEEISFEGVTNEGTNKNGYTDDIIDPIECADIKVLSGRFDQNPGWGGEYNNMNNHSIVVRVDFGEASFIFTGDLEEDAIETVLSYYLNDQFDEDNIFDTDVYEVGHHGSHNGTTAELLNAITPEIAVISCGEWDSGKESNYPFSTYYYGHPRESTIDLLKLAITKYRSDPVTEMIATGAKDFHEEKIRDKIYCTAWDGNIKIRAKKDGSFIVYIDQ